MERTGNLTEKEIIIEWNRTETPFPEDKTFHELFVEQVEKTPDNIAVSYKDTLLTYRELNMKVNRLAGAIREHYRSTLKREPAGDDLTGLCVERTPEMITGILAIMKAGSAYVPLDPSYPADRIRYMTEESGMKVILTVEDILEKLPFFTEDGRSVICFDRDSREIDKYSSENLLNINKPEDLAYIIYTSGSTGKPKGIMIEHRNLVNLATDHMIRFDVTEKSRVLQYISMSFDASFVEISPALISGAGLYIVSKEDRVDPDKLFSFLLKNKITHAVFPAALFELLPKKEGLSVEVFIAGGDVCTAHTFNFWADHARVFNAYGPSETTVCATASLYDDTKLPGQIGKPVQNVTACVLDEKLEPLPAGEAGELYIGGAGVGRGYLHREDLTAKSFIENPFVSEEDRKKGRITRLYKTGDLVKWLPEGELLFLGRVDFQVKIRGFRIEPEEIEKVFNSHPDIRQSVVIPREKKGEKYLVAYYILKSEDSSLSRNEIHDYLKTKLSDYMIPSYFVKLDRFPLTPNGKIDRKALPEPVLSDILSKEEYIEAETDEEKTLAHIWCDVLGLAKVGVKDNFFSIGGHSLSATLVVSRIQESFNISCPVSAIFENPTVQNLALFINKELSKKDGKYRQTEIVPVNRDEALTLSFAQQRLWFLDQYEHEQNIAYNIPMAFRLKGSLNLNALEHGINTLIERHESLRTVFKSHMGEAEQVIMPPFTVNLRPEKIQEKDLEKMLCEETLKPFDLEKGPLIRCRLFELKDKDSVMIINQHHIISDGWSAWIFLKELEELYGAYIEDRPAHLKPLKIQYADFASWQKKWFSGEVMEEQVDYWKKKLVNFEELNLPADGPRPGVKTFKGDHYYFTVDREITSFLKNLSKDTGSSLFMVLLSAFNVLLKDYTGQEDIILGSPIAGRNNRDIEGLIGFFVNTLVLRNDLSGDISFTELLEKIKKTCLDAYSHQDIPFEYIVDALKVKRESSRNPIFDVMFVLQNAGEELCPALPGIASKVVKFEYNTAKFDIQLSLTETEEGLSGEFEYNTDLYNHSTIREMGKHFIKLLESIRENPEEKIKNLRILTEEEEEILKSWNSTEAPFPEDKTLHELFEEQVEITPDSVAVIVEDCKFTYRELNDFANSVAHTLRETSSVKRDTPVGLCMERSFYMIAGILAIMKAGGAYVPLDPDYPEERLAFIMEDGGIKVVITQKELDSRLKFLRDKERKVICLDTDREELDRAPSVNPAHINTPSDIAYIIYTSGSTGKPKGVMVEHRGVVNRILWMQKEYRLTPADRVLQKTPFSFDVSVWEFLWPIFSGSVLCFAKPGGHKDPEYLIKAIEDYGITTMHFVPSMLDVFLDTLKQKGNKLTSVKRIICSGEALSTKLAMKCFELVPSSLHNLYGPTEASVDVTYQDCSSPLYRNNPGIPIGKPIDNIKLYILDKDLQQVPPGIPGELYISGVGLARGYVNLPSLTKERFIENPFVIKGNGRYYERLYKTGDLVRYLPDGAIDYLGRTDFQVKLRGFRIELGEIESVICRYEGIRRCVVIAGEEDGEKLLVAYYVADDGSGEISVEKIRSFMKEKLPEYMVPSIFMKLPELPLTQSGKVNRKALPAPVRKGSVTEGEFVPPERAEEKHIALIWQDVLHLEKTGIYDNFFTLGGHSLSATRVASRIQQTFQISCPVKVIFEYPTIRELSLYVCEQLSQGALQSYSITPADREDFLPLSFAQQRLWFLHHYEEGLDPTYNIPLAYRLKGKPDIPALEKSFNRLIERHESFRTVFRTAAGEASQEILEAFSLNLTAETAAEEDIQGILSEEARFKFDLEKGPLVRVRLLKIADNDYILIINQHHIISDGWSVDIMLKELGELYRAYTSNTDPLLAELKFQYADFASWQRKWLTGEILEEQVRYWRKKLENFTSLDLPADHIRPKIKTTEGSHYLFSMKSMNSPVTALAKETGTTPFMVLLGAFNVFLGCYSGKEDIIIGSPIANRNHRGLEDIVGFFVNSLVFRNDLSGNPDFRELLKRVKETCLDAYGHQDLPFEKLVEELHIERDPGHNPLFDVMFLVEDRTTLPALPGISVEELAVGYDISKFDLTFTFKESEEDLECIIEYNSRLYDRKTIESMAGHFDVLLRSILADPGRCINKFSVLTEKEKEEILTDWNKLETSYPQDKTVEELFQEQVEKTPENIAVVMGDKKLTYRELNEKANRVAHTIRGHYKWMYDEDLKPDTVIGLCLNRSLELIIGTLGVLKAGCAYMPMDPTYPDNRLTFMMDDACSPIMLTEQAVLERLLFLNEAEYGVISLDGGWKAIEERSGENPECINRPDNLAYVIYTSGSTGKPKGVMVEHKSIVRLVKETNYISITEKDNIAHAANISFDAATLEIWGALLNGATLTCVSQDMLLNIEHFTEFLEKEKITVLWLTASLFHYYGNHNPSMFRHLRYLLSGGDTLNPDVIYKVLRCSEGSPQYLINGYGPTENTTFTTTYHIEKPLCKGRSIPIGKPIAGTTCYILDRHRNLLPVGVPGELYTGGDGVSRGYFRRPELTDERFIENPFVSEHDRAAGRNTRLYKTGDLVRWLPDGNIEFLGRTDFQIKIRGFRVELEEIEALLGSHEAVSECVVVVRAEGEQKQIVAYYVPEEDKPVTSSDLRNFLEKELPEYMIPSVFVEMRSFPMTSHHKVDRRALPAPEEKDFMAGSSFVAPRTEEEKILASIWKSVLRLDCVGINDNFFTAGGDSIMSIQVISRAREAGLHLTPRQLFSHPTIAELAKVALRTEEVSVKVSQEPITGEVPLTPIQLWFFEKDFSVKNHFNQAFLLKLNRKIETSCLEETLKTLVKHHDSLRLRYCRGEDGKWKQKFSEGEEALNVALHIIDIPGDVSQNDFIQNKSSEIQASLNIEDTIMAAALFPGHEDRRERLLIVIHHLVVDMVSWRIILEDFENIYTQLSEGKDLSLPLKTSSYRDWSEALVNYGKSEGLRKQEHYWSDIEKEVKPFYTELESEVPSVKDTEDRSVFLDKPLTLSLLNETSRAYNTQINDILLSALAMAYCEWTGERELLLDLEGHGREECIKDADVSRTVGWFTSIYPVRLRLADREFTDDISVSSVIKSVKEQLRSIPDKGMGYGVLRYLKPEACSLTGLRGMGFNYLGKIDASAGDLFTFEDDAGYSISPENKSLHLIDLNGFISEDIFKMTFTFSRKNYRPESIENFARAFRDNLEKIIEHCKKDESGGYTPSDFPLAEVTQTFLDGLYGSEIESLYMAGPLQTGLLFHALYEPESDQYCTQLYWTYEGDLDKGALKKAWEILVERYGIFRTAFLWEGLARPVQAVYKKVDLPWQEEDWIKFSHKDKKQKLQDYLKKERDKGFDFSRPCVMRLSLIRLEKEKYEFIWTHHHILLDGWCLSILMAELKEIYGSLRKGREIKLPEAPLYKNYIAWLCEQNKEETSAFWKEHLAGFDAPTELNINEKKPDIHKPIVNLKKNYLHFSPSETILCEEFSKKNQITLNALIKLSWASVLSFYSGQEDLLLGATVSGRPGELPGVEKMVGLFINTLPFRIKIDKEKPALEKLQALHRTIQEANHYSTMTLNELQAFSQVPAGIPMFYSLYVFENYPDSASTDTEGLSMTDIQSFEKTNYPLTVVVAPGKKLEIMVLYDGDTFEEEVINRLLFHIHNMADWIIKNPEKPLTEAQIITKKEYEDIITGWNETEKAFPSHKTVQELFEEEVEKRPDHVALVFEDRHFTYKELNSEANRLARLLRNYMEKEGNNLTGLCAERSPQSVIAMIAILKAGGAYVPMDSEYPEERIKFMLSDTGIKIIVSQKKMLQSLPFLSEDGRKVILLDDDRKELEGFSPENPEILSGPESLAYIIYTSGSTGIPKGVMIDQRSIVRLARDQEYLSIYEDDTVAHSANISFDAATFEVWAPLLNGARIAILSKETLLTPPLLKEKLSSCKVTVQFLTTALFHLLIDKYPETFQGHRVVLFGGEESNAEKVGDFLANKEKGTEVLHVYGPTETTTFATYCVLTEDYTGSRVMPIGKGLSGKTLYVLDRYLRPVPVGIPGELYIGGEGIALGYLNRNELTEERFIENPFVTEKDRGEGINTRLYKTGDLVKWLPDGNLVFIGRTDFQVKIRGFRIEPGEIEAKLARHPGVSECLVIVMKIKEEKQIVAYYVPHDETLGQNDLRLYLEKDLPPYMIPGFFIRLDSFPLNPNRKIDRKALPVPTGEETAVTFVPPRNEDEKAIAHIWCDVLDLEKVGINDNFFTLGGHSLTATQVVSRIQQTFNISVPIKAVFDYPDISRLSAFVRHELTEHSLHDDSIEKADRSRVLPLSFAQERLWFLDQYEGTSSNTYNIPVSFRLIGKPDIKAMEKSFNFFIARHESLRTVFKSIDGVPCQEILPSLEIKIEKRKVNKEELPGILSEEGLRPFDLSSGPLFRAIFFETGEDEYILFINQHHIISDGWSMGILYREIKEIYAAYASGTVPDLPPVKIDYPDFAVWQRKWLQGEYLEEELDYWRKKLADYSNLDLPSDRPRPPVQTYSGSRYFYYLDAELQEDLKKLAKETNTTLFMVLSGAFNILLSRYSGQEDIVMGSPIANRNRSDIEDIYGFFVNTLVLRNDLSGNPSFSEFLERVKETCLEAYSHQDVQFEHLVDILGVKRDISRHPVFNVMFALQNAASVTAPELHGLQIEDAGIEYDISKFDLTFNLMETADGLDCEIEYNTDLYTEETVRKMAGHFRVLLEGIIRNPGEKIQELPVLTEEEKKLILYDWNDTERDFPKDRTIQEIFEEEAAKNPDNIAVFFEGKSLTYKELNEKANCLARIIREDYLKITGETVRGDIPAGLCMDRGTEMIVGMLGILKAGCAYVPLDPAYPENTLSFIMNDINSPLVVTRTPLLERLPFLKEGRHAITVDTVEEDNDRDNPPVINNSHNLSYMIYTSGSTGKPKGVMIEHRGAVNFVLSEQKLRSINASSRVLQFATINFDAAVAEIYPPLLCGGSLYILPEELRKDPDGLLDYIKTHRITHATLTPPLLSALPEAELLSLEAIVVAGDVCDRAVMNYWSRGRKLFNGYGPTENTVCATMCLYDESRLHSEIGYAIQNVKLYVLNSHLVPLPAGIPGELYIGGTGVARGYLNRPDLTEEHFIENPFVTDREKSEGRNMVLYKTGDLVKWLERGSLEFLGRIDFQVKIRGFRIELGGIETVMNAHEDIKECVVTAGEEKGHRRIVAYYIPEKGREDNLSSGVLRSYLEEHLPEYMIPSVFMKLESFPLSPSGKINRKALPVPEEIPLMDEDHYVAPKTEEEKILVRVWEDVLGIKPVGINDDFFSLGGDSIMTIQVISRARKEGLPVSPKQLFAHPTIAGIAKEVLKIDKTVRGKVPLAQQRCLSPESGSFSPSDFPLALITQPVLNNLLKEYDIETIYGLSPLQEGFLFHALYAPDSDQYTTQVMWVYEKTLNAGALKKAWEKVISRHAILRTAFISERTEKPFQAVLKKVILPWYEEDWSNLSEEEQEKKLVLYAEADREKGFSMTSPPLMRLHLINLGERGYEFIFTNHHILLDGWSIPVLMDEVVRYYIKIDTGTDVKIPVTAPYEDYIRWIHEKDRGEAEKFWQEQLSGLEEPTPIPVNYRSLDIHKPITDLREEVIYFSEEFTEKCYSFAREKRITLNALLQMAWAGVLSSYSGQDDIVTGITVSGRVGELPGIENMIGLFINTLPLRIKIDEKKSALEHLLTLHNTIQYINHYSYISLSHIQSYSHIAPGSPLFYSIYAFENYPVGTVEESSLTIGVSNLKAYGKTNYPLTVGVEPGKKIMVKIGCDGDCFTDETVKALMSHIKEATQWLIENPHRAMSEMELITGREKELLRQWNKTDVPCSREKTVHGIFEEQVRKTPSNTAVLYEDLHVSYEELNRKANRLAHRLRNSFKASTGEVLKRDSVVALCLERGIEMSTGMMGILKAGGAYMPLDPHIPEDRMTYTLENSECKIVVTTKNLMKELTCLKNDGRLVICADGEDLDRESSENPENINTSSDLAYVIYTSGSTGKPKGVMLEHHGAVNHMEWMEKEFNLTQEDRVLQKTPFYFDASVWELMLPLLSGAVLVYAKPEGHKDPAYLTDVMEKQGITVVQFVPSLLEAVLGTKPAKEKFKTLRILCCGGEVFTVKLKDECLKYFDAMIYNLYGPTEATIDATFYKYNPLDKTPLTALPIGKAVNNTRLYVTDKYFKETPPGVPGELYIGGAGLARGYLNLPEMTRQRFIDNPFVTEEEKKEGIHTRLYKTGDLARWLFDGNLEFLSRTDFQVKLRGFRIELGEIESVLDGYEGISRSAVVACDAAGEKHLAAYYVMTEENMEEIPLSKLRDYLSESLPDYMVPSFFIKLDSFPVTPSGKLDRKSLPHPEESIQTERGRILEARDPVEYNLQKIWAALLGIPAVSIDENFFAAGGHSLLSIRLISKVQEYFNITYPVSWVFSHDTIQKQAEAIRSHQDVSMDYKPFLSFNETGRKAPIFFVHPGGGGAAAYCELAGLLGGEQPFYAIESYNMYSNNPLLTTVEALSEKYIAFMEELKKEGPYYLGGWSFGGLIAYEMARKLTEKGYKINNVYLMDTFMPDEEDRKLLSKLNNREFMKEMLSQKEFYNQLPQHFREKILKIQSVEDEATYSYSPGKYSGRVMLFKAAEKVELPEGISPEAREVYEKISEKDMACNDKGWSSYVANLEVRAIKGNHGTIILGESLREIAGIIQGDSS